MGRVVLKKSDFISFVRTLLFQYSFFFFLTNYSWKSSIVSYIQNPISKIANYNQFLEVIKDDEHKGRASRYSLHVLAGFPQARRRTPLHLLQDLQERRLRRHQGQWCFPGKHFPKLYWGQMCEEFWLMLLMNIALKIRVKRNQWWLLHYHIPQWICSRRFIILFAFIIIIIFLPNHPSFTKTPSFRISQNFISENGYMYIFNSTLIISLWKTNIHLQKGMPYKVYHGRTGRVFNVTKRGLGVIVNKRVR